MKIARNTVYISFLIYNILFFFIMPVVETTSMLLGQEELWEILLDLEEFCPLFLSTRYILMISVSTGKIHITIIMAIIGLLPLIACIFIKKPWVYRILSSIITIPLCIMEISSFDHLPIQIGNIVYIFLIIAVDVLNTIYICREKRNAYLSVESNQDIEEEMLPA